MELEGKVAMISGGSKGLGAALARRFAEEGAAVSLCARGGAALREVCRELEDGGARCLAVEADVADADAVERWFDATVEELGRVDAVVNNASLLGPRVAIEDYPEEDWREVVEVNLTGAFLVARAAVPRLAGGGGSLIHVSSGVGDHGRPRWGAYCASKNGLEALSEMMAGELEDRGIRSNAVDPGAMRTGMRAAAYPEEDPMSNPTPYEVTDVFVWLASDASRGVTGERFRAKEFDAAAV
jgi:NAD(P)-dependent dehydrogenase (short-subunit alcohol dehydrogenase family)